MVKHSPSKKSKRFPNRNTKESMTILNKYVKGDIKNANDTIKHLEKVFLPTQLNLTYKKDILEQLKKGKLTAEEAERKLHFFVRLEREFVPRNNNKKSNEKPNNKKTEKNKKSAAKKNNTKSENNKKSANKNKKSAANKNNTKSENNKKSANKNNTNNAAKKNNTKSENNKKSAKKNKKNAAKNNNTKK